MKEVYLALKEPNSKENSFIIVEKGCYLSKFVCDESMVKRLMDEGWAVYLLHGLQKVNNVNCKVELENGVILDRSPKSNH